MARCGISSFRFAGMRYLARLTAGLLTCLAIAAGCGDDGVQGVSFRVVSAPAAGGGRCPVNPVLAPTTHPNVDKVRLTFRAAQQGEFVCDIVVGVADDDPILAIPEFDGLLDVYAEYFAGSQLISSGVVPNVDFNRPQLVEIVANPANSFACAPPRLATARAFHSATRLPNGEVLIVGGVAATTEQLSIAGGDPLFVGNSVELYDPRFGEVRQLTIPDLLPRGFHDAVVLSGGNDGEVVIALFGGITVDGDPARVPAAFTGAPGTNNMRLIPASSAKPAPLELILYDVASGVMTRLAPGDTGQARMLAATTGGQARPKSTPLPIVVAGGASDAQLTPAADFEVRNTTAAALNATANLDASRFGATATILSGGTVLVWGGHLNVADADLLTFAGEQLVGLETTPSTTMLNYSAAGLQPTPRVHHAAALTGTGQVVIAGGYRIADNRSDDVDPTFVQVLDIDGQITVSEPTTSSALAAVGAGYPSASSLANGDVLVSGGNSDVAISGCSGAVHPLTCSTAASYRYDQLTGILDDTPTLSVSRFGHRSSPLAGGGLLVTGGLHAEGQTLLLVNDIEVFNPATTDTDPLDDLGNINRLPGETAKTNAGEPLSECRIVR